MADAPIQQDDKLEYSETTQTQIIAELLRNHDFAISVLGTLKPHYFTKDKFVDVITVLFNYVERFKTVPTSADNFIDHFRDLSYANKKLTLDDGIQNFVKALLTKNPDGTWAYAYDTKFIHEKVNKFLKEAAMKEAIWSAAHKLNEGKESAFEEIRGYMIKALSVGVSSTGTALCNDITSLLARFKASRERKFRIATPITRLNDFTNGGIGKKELFVIMAPPNKGKSLAMCSFAATALNTKRKVIYYTLEMSEDKIAWRLIQNLGNFTEAELLMNSPEVAARMQRMHQRISTDITTDPIGQKITTHDNRDIIIKYFSSKACNINTLYSHLAIVEAKGFVPDVIFVDYADLMSPTKTYSDKRAELSSIYTELRELGIEKNIAVVTASQANRSSLSQDLVSLEHIAEDFGKVAIADIITTISQNSAERSSGRCRFYLAKNRDGQVDEVFEVPVNYSTMTLGDISDSGEDVEAAMEAPIR